MQKIVYTDEIIQWNLLLPSLESGLSQTSNTGPLNAGPSY